MTMSLFAASNPVEQAVRRVLLVTAAALACLVGVSAEPVLAQRPDTALVSLGGATPINAFVAYPAVKGKAPAVIVVHEEWGLDGPVRSVARRLAAEGYVAIVPDLYHGRVTDDPGQAQAWSRALASDAALADLDATMAWLATQPRVQAGRVAVVGFGMGGTFALEYGIHEPRVRAVVMFYGVPITDAGRLPPLKAPVLAHFGQLDEATPEDKVNQFRLAMNTAGRNAEIHLYPGAGHAFMSDAQPTFQAESARRAWARTLAFLQKQVHD
jgi:carboxymethylenebutenolidase